MADTENTGGEGGATPDAETSAPKAKAATKKKVARKAATKKKIVAKKGTKKKTRP